MTTTKTLVQPYLFFGGRCEEALEFYKQAVGAEVEVIMHFDEAPEPPPARMLAEGFAKKVMHSSFRIGEMSLMASDGCSTEEANFHGFQLAMNVPTEADADRVFNALSEGGKVEMPLAKTFWSPRYGMLTDKFGLGWMVMVPGESDCKQ